MLIEDGKVTEVGQKVSVPKGVAELDLGGYTCLPGLIDMNAHLTTGSHETADLGVHYRRTAAEQGAIARGRFGDLITVKGDPVQDTSALQHLNVVVKGSLAFNLAAR